MMKIINYYLLINSTLQQAVNLGEDINLAHSFALLFQLTPLCLKQNGMI